MRKLAMLGGVAALALTFGTGAASAQDQAQYTYLHHATPTNVFWQAVKLGMDEACAQIDADCQMVFLQQDGNFQEQLNNLEAAIAQQPDGIINTFAGGKVFDEAIDRAMAAGIPVLASNVDHPDGTHRLSFTGQDLEQAGYDLAAGLAPQFPEEGPIHVLIGISGPGQVWAESRGAGIARFMEDYITANPDREITYEKIDSGLDLCGHRPARRRLCPDDAHHGLFRRRLLGGRCCGLARAISARSRARCCSPASTSCRSCSTR